MAVEVPAGDLAKIQKAAPGEAPAKVIRPRRVLVFTLAKGFVHKATPWGVAALRIVGEKTGAYTIVASEDPNVFERDSLAKFDAVCFLNTCYTPFTDAVLKQNLMDFVKGGKGYVGIHCSAHTFLDWPEFGQLQGAYSVSHPWHEKVTVTIEEPEHPLMKCFGGKSFSISDEIYMFDKRYSRQRLRVLASLDTSRSDMTKPGITRKDGDFGLVWVQRFGKGRAFYSAFGHDKEVFWEPTVLRHYLAGIQFACGDLAADATPSARLPGETTLTNEGWTIEASRGRGRLTVKHERLGTVLHDAQLNIEADGALRELKQWTVEIGGAPAHKSSSRASEQEQSKAQSAAPSRLLVRTAQPASTWIFEPTRDCLKISSTAPAAVLTGLAPVSKTRGLARLLDAEGTPVTWQGTGECAGTYGGGFTRNPSFLPRENPDCMYFALGQASGSVFHSLFDRQTDTAVRFPEQTRFSSPDASAEQLAFTMPLPGPGLVRLIPDYYTKVLRVPRYVPQDTSVFDRAPMVWCSWTSYFADATEDDIVRNTDWLAEHLKPHGFQYVTIDDGYDRIPGKFGPEGHNWIDQWDKDKYPKGPKWIAGYIKSKGLRPGLWLVPNSYAGAVKTHPDWYLRDAQGRFIRDYNTPALDSSNPEVLGFLKDLFGTLGSWGFEYYKFDGEFSLPAYAPRVDPNRLHDRTADPVETYRRRLEVIRQAIGPRTFVEGCPSGTPLNGIGYFNSYFNGQDVYNNWHGMYMLFDSINANAFLNRMVVYVMPGETMELCAPMCVEQAKRTRSPRVVDNARQREAPMIGFGVTLAEARTVVSVVALTGVAYPLGDVMPELPPDRLPLLHRTLPTMPIAPMDLFSRGSDADWACFRSVRADDYIHHYPEILDLKVAAKSGTYDVVALPNWRSAPVTKTVSLSRQLGLDAGEKYVAFDFWNQALLGVVSDRMSLEVEGHDTRVVLIHRLLDHPQLIGTSRHITGAYSIRDLSWDAASSTLQGVSEIVPGQDYTLFIHIPPGSAATSTPTASAGGKAIPVRQERKGDLLSVSFKSPESPVAWQVKF